MNLRPLLVRCYPARWRVRYGDEFEAILEERPLGPFDAADILLGAFDAQLRLRNVGAAITTGRGFSMSLRIGGFAAIIGGALWPLGFYVFADPAGAGLSADRAVAALVLIIGSVALVVALAGLSAFQARAHPGFAWAAFLLPAVGLIASIVGVIGMQGGGDYWGVWSLGTLAAFAGWTLFAVLTYRTAALSRGAALLLGVGSILALGALMGITSLPGPFVIVAFIVFALGWFALGVHAIRLDRPAIAPGSV